MMRNLLISSYSIIVQFNRAVTQVVLLLNFNLLKLYKRYRYFSKVAFQWIKAGRLRIPVQSWLLLISPPE